MCKYAKLEKNGLSQKMKCLYDNSQCENARYCIRLKTIICDYPTDCCEKIKRK